MSDAAISLSAVSKQYSNKLAVSSVSFEVPTGSCFGLIGPNGAGKTTTFSMLCGFVQPTGGEVRVMGKRPLAPGELKGLVGVLPQDAILPPWATVGELLMYWARLSGLPRPEQEAREALERVELSPTWKTRAGTLSHGMAKRVAMAQALMGQPPVVLLDEPTAGLDPKIAAQVRAIIRSMKGRHTIVVSSHNLQELEELCDAAAILDKGKLVYSGSVEQLTSKTDEFRVEIGSGVPNVDALRGLPGVTKAIWDGKGSLLVHFSPRDTDPAKAISDTLRELLRTEVLVLGVSRGKRLEERVLELT